MPPNPFGHQAVRPVSYWQAAYYGYPYPMVYGNPAMDRPGMGMTAPGYGQADPVQQHLATLKTALFAPIPSASASTATSAKPGLWRSVRSA